MSYRVIQWATGNVGMPMLRAIIDHPELELVGVYVSSDKKVGKDAGELCGRSRIGIAATNDMEALIGLEADCVNFNTSGELRGVMKTIKDICRLLASGKNVTTTSFAPLVYPPAVPGAFTERLETACREGGTTFYCSGIDPGFSCDALPILLSTLSERIDSVRAQEIFDYSGYDSAASMFEFMGFGKPPEFKPPFLAPGALTMSWGPSVHMIGKALGVTVGDIHETQERVYTEEPFEIVCGTIEKGTQAGLRFEIIGIVGGEPRIVCEHITRLREDIAPHWPQGNSPATYRIILEGSPSLRCDLDVGFGQDDGVVQGLVGTGMRALNAIPYVCQDEPGLRSWLDYPGMAATGAMR
jgi:4-hydroxy-tetrahydrodipicolinate reductase